ncbi:MAG: DUF2138 family protein [Magnetococcales bacterium]|nr:DUF2138 family protein [Magnetococcales bacterium]
MITFSSRQGWMAVLLPVVAVAAWVAASRGPSLPPAPPPQPLPQDRLFQPDVVIQSRALSKLPKDLLAIPLLGELLTEEFVFYYEQNENRLSLEGTFRRLAYEKHMGVGDEIVATVLNTPAQIAFWKSPDGKLKDYLMLLPKQGLLRFIDALSWLAENDSQLFQNGRIDLADGTSFTVWRIEHVPKRHLYFAVYGDQLAIYTDPALFNPQGGKRLEAIRHFFRSAGTDALGVSLRLPPLTGQHRIAARASYISFGYQHFFPALETLRFDYQADKGWSTAILSNAATPLPGSLWQRVPTGPALCLALPVDKPRLLNFLRQLKDDPLLPELVQRLRPPAALCWYGDSQLHTPLAVLPVEKGRESWRPLLASLFEENIGTRERLPQSEGENALPPQGVRKVAAPKVRNPLPVEESACEGGHIWRRHVSSAYAPLDAKQSPYAEAMRSKRYFSMVFALCRDTLILTPDQTLAERALGVLSRSYPSLAESLTRGGESLSVTLAPRPLARLLRQSLEEGLPSEREPVFHQSVKKRFMPLLDKVASRPAQDLETPRQAGVWEPLTWRARSDTP